MFLTISLVIFFVLLLALIHIKFNVSLHIKTNDDEVKLEKINGTKNFIKIKLGVIPVYIKNILDNEKEKQNDKKKIKKKNIFAKIFTKKEIILKLLDKSKVESFLFSLGFNTNNPIANAYINASINTILCLVINYRQDNFNLNKLYYQTYISDNLLVFNFEGKISISLVDIIKIVIKVYINEQNRAHLKNIDEKKLYCDT